MLLSRFVLVVLVLVLLGGCRKKTLEPPKSKTTHSTSAMAAPSPGVKGTPPLSEKQAFVERYVTFRRSYTSLDFKIDYEDDTSTAPGPSSVGCDVRIYAHVPEAQLGDWTSGLVASPGSSSSPTGGLEWIAEIPNAPKSLEAFTWFEAPPSSFGGSKVVGIAKATSEVLYRLICARN